MEPLAVRLRRLHDGGSGLCRGLPVWCSRCSLHHAERANLLPIQRSAWSCMVLSVVLRVLYAVLLDCIGDSECACRRDFELDLV